ncbi:YbhQ family protein [Klebsiella variicola]|uniref:YbhQ family protein n=1 Tax=Klebsiella variicola TaxID=244366 RepID=UPI0007CA501B|nr:membrane protein [Klebsiella variicola]SAT77225.1 membrane protein [Klebsiella variicola]
MKWQQRVRVATGLSCWQIMLHLLVVAVLVMGWMSGALVRVGLGLCVLYSVTLLAMLFLQRHHEARWRDVGDFLEELTTTWYFGAAMIALWLLSRVLHNNLLLALAGLVILAGPACEEPTYLILTRNTGSSGNKSKQLGIFRGLQVGIEKNDSTFYLIPYLWIT